MAKKKITRTSTSQRMTKKYAEKNKPMTPEQRKRTIIICSVVAVILLAVILVVSLWPDGSLPVKNGVVVTEGDNWLILNKGSQDRPKYYKLGEFTAIDGFTSDESWVMSSDSNVTSFWVENNDTEAAFASYAIDGVNAPANEIAPSAYELIAQYGGEMISDAVRTTTINDQECYYYFYFAPSATAEENQVEEGEELVDPVGSYCLVTYCPGVRDCSIMLEVSSNQRYRSETLTEEEMLEWARQAYNGFVVEVEEKEEK